VKGKIARPLYESRFVGIFAQPESLFTTAAQTLDYQFVSKFETWFFQAAQKNLAVLLLVQFAALILSTTIVFVDAGEQRAGTFRQAGGDVRPGAHFSAVAGIKFTASAPSRFSPSPSATRRMRRPRRRTQFSGRSATTRKKISLSPTARLSLRNARRQHE